MINYNEYIQSLEGNNILPPYPIYFYQNRPIENIFQQFFDFCVNDLIETEEECNITPSHFYFENSLTVNARAILFNNNRYIGIFRGAIEDLWMFYDNKSEIVDRDEFEHYKAIAGHKNISVEHLLYQFTTLYLYYHEKGHLRQFDNTCQEISLMENLAEDVDQDSSLYRHTLEFDADWFASTQLAFHLIDFYKNADGDIESNAEQITDLVSLGFAAIFNYYILTAQNIPEIYYRRKSHPHPYVRMTYQLQFMFDNINPNLPDGLEVNFVTALSNGVVLSEQFLMNDFINQAMTFAGVFLIEGENIEEEINRIKTAAEQNPNLNINKLA